jgi:transcriptional regulator of acetoin/glycerol metabolism
VVESLLLMSDAPDVRLDELAAGLSSEPIGAPPAAAPAEGVAEAPTSLGASERAAIVEAVRLCHGNLTAAAKSLGVSRSTLYRKIERHRLPI